MYFVHQFQLFLFQLFLFKSTILIAVTCFDIKTYQKCVIKSNFNCALVNISVFQRLWGWYIVLTDELNQNLSNHTHLFTQSLIYTFTHSHIHTHSHINSALIYWGTHSLGLILWWRSCTRSAQKRLRWFRGKRAGLWYPSSRVQTRLKPSDFSGEKILSAPSFGGEVKPSAPCRKLRHVKEPKSDVEVATFGKIFGNFSPIVPPSATGVRLHRFRRWGLFVERVVTF